MLRRTTSEEVRASPLMQDNSETFHTALSRCNIQVTQPYYLITLLVPNDAIVTILQPRTCLLFGTKGEAEEKAEGVEGLSVRGKG